MSYDDLIDGVVNPKVQGKTAYDDLIDGVFEKPPQKGISYGSDGSGAYANIRLSNKPAGARRKRLELPEWNALVNTGDAFGLGLTVIPTAAAVKTTENIITGDQPLSNFWEDYKQNAADIRAKRDNWKKDNFWTGLGTDIVGSIVPTNALMGAGERLLAGGVEEGTRFAGQPGVGTAITNFFGGQAGRDATAAAGETMFKPGIGNLALRVASRGTQGAVQGAGNALLMGGMYQQPLDEQITNGALGGALVNGALGGVTQRVGDFILPKVETEVAKTAQEAANAGIDLSGLQISPYSAAHNLFDIAGSEAQQRQLRQAQERIAKSIGLTGSDLGDSAFHQARKDIGNRIESFAQQAPMTPPTVFSGVLRGLASKFAGDPYLQAGRGEVNNALQSLAADLQKYSGGIGGDEFVRMTGSGSKIAQLLDSDNPLVKKYGLEMKQGLLQALEGHLQNSHPGLVEGLRESRKMLNNWYTIENSGARSAGSGKVDPIAMAKEVAATQFQKDGKLKIIEKIGSFMPDMNMSGGAETRGGLGGKVSKILFEGAAPVSAGAAGYALTGFNPLLMGGLVGTGLAATSGLKHIVNDPGYRNMLINKALRHNLPEGSSGALKRGLQAIKKKTPGAVGTITNALYGTQNNE